MHLFNSNRSVVDGHASTPNTPDEELRDLPAASAPDLVGGRSGSRLQLDRSLRGITFVGAHQSILRRGASLKRPA